MFSRITYCFIVTFRPQNLAKDFTKIYLIPIPNRPPVFLKNLSKKNRILLGRRLIILKQTNNVVSYFEYKCLPVVILHYPNNELKSFLSRFCILSRMIFSLAKLFVFSAFLSIVDFELIRERIVASIFLRSFTTTQPGTLFA